MNNNLSKWIWFDGECSPVNCYIDFRREFNVPDNSLSIPAKLLISSETNFVAWLNGEFIGTGQFGDYPNAETYSTFDVADKLIKGKNVISVTAYHCGEDNASYISSNPGLWFELHIGKLFLNSDERTTSRISSVYRQGEMPRSTKQMGFTFEFDVSQDDQWQKVKYKTSKNWRDSREASRPQPTFRPLPPPVIGQRTPFNIIAQGTLKRMQETTTNPSQLMQSDYLSARRNNEIFSNIGVSEIHHDKPVKVYYEKGMKADDGIYVVIDMQREECGFIDFEIDSPSGMVIDVAIGEHLADLRVRSYIGKRSFASRVTTKNGKQRFTHYITRVAGRFLQLHITNISKSFTIEYVGLLPFEYPLPQTSKFVCADSILNKIYEISCRTLHLCMHEHYEDCPWREQALYANDSRNQALAGYYTFGEYKFPGVSFELLGRSAGDDGYLSLCAPMISKRTIPSFTMVWLLAMADHLHYSGDYKYAKQYLPLIHKVICQITATMKNHLLPSPTGAGYWHFYDWADGLSGTLQNGELNEERYDAPLNFMLIMALRATAVICEECKDIKSAESYRALASSTADAAHKIFWNKEEKLYCTDSSQEMKSHFSELIQALALLTKCLPSSIAIELRNRLSQNDNGMVKTTLSQCFYKFEALLQEKEKYGATVFSQISGDWSKMLFDGATSFWETESGQSDFGYAGSLCHGWSATPAYFYGAYILGVKPLTPGFKTFAVNPFFAVTPQASGSIPTPDGDITVSWHVNIDKDGKKSVTGKIIYPESLKVSSKPNHFKLQPYKL